MADETAEDYAGFYGKEVGMISDFRQEFIGYVDSLAFGAYYDFMPAEMKDNTALVIGDIRDKATDANIGIQPLIYAREITVYCLAKVRNNKHAEAENLAFEHAVDVMSVLDATTLSFTLQRRASVGYTIGQYQYRGAELVLEFYNHD